MTDTGLPTGWEIRVSNSKRRAYFFNVAEAVSTWDPPFGSDIARVEAYIAANVKIPPKPAPGADADRATAYAVENAAAYTENSNVDVGRKAPTSVEASHLLIKHRDSRNPKSWREANITRTKEEARAILEAHRAAIFDEENQKKPDSDQSKTTLATLAKTESDCSSARAFGDLGRFSGGQMQQPFWDASVKLEVGEISDIVETASGLHLIQRTG